MGRHTFYKNNEMAGYCAVLHALQLKGIDGHYGNQRKVVIFSFGAVSRGAIYALKAHGFRDALDYYEKASCLQFLPNIKIPALVINALNDSFLSSDCYPVKEAKQNSNLFLEMPKHGGHVGFVDKKNIYYNEKRALDFVLSVF